jgi:hypothetical protein
VEATTAALGRPALLIDLDGWYAALTAIRLGDPVVRIIAIAATLLGLLILLAQLRRWNPERITTRFGAGWHLQRRSLERRLARAAAAVPGVTAARARIRRCGAGWRPRIRALGDPSVRCVVEDAIRSELDRLAAPTTGPVDIDVLRTRRSR